MNTQQVFCGDNIELLKQYPDNHFDSIVTDAPYGLGKEPNGIVLDPFNGSGTTGIAAKLEGLNYVGL